MKIVTSAVDPEINDKFHVLPGMGNFGDRWVILGDKWVILGDKWVILGDKWVFLGTSTVCVSWGQVGVS